MATKIRVTIVENEGMIQLDENKFNGALKYVKDGVYGDMESMARNPRMVKDVPQDQLAQGLRTTLAREIEEALTNVGSPNQDVDKEYRENILKARQSIEKSEFIFKNFAGYVKKDDPTGSQNTLTQDVLPKIQATLAGALRLRFTR